MAKVRAALLEGERRIFVGFVDVDEEELGPDHLPQISQSDLPPNEYRWVADEKHELGGYFVPLKVRAALLEGERRIFVGMVEVDELELGPDHLPQITDCNLPPHQYRWAADERLELGGRFMPLRVKAALIDRERQIYLGMVEVDELELGPEHLPQITECDLPPLQYRWQPIEGHLMGGQFVPLPPAQRAVAGNVTLEQAVAYDFLVRRERGEVLPDVTLAYLDGLVMSFDFKGDQSPLVVAYRQARGLVNGE